jgi:glycosyltransferase involved in cell wall biosynthesis
MPGSVTMTPYFSVVIPTHDRPAALGNCLEGLAELDYPKKAYEVIVVDDGSTRSVEPVVDSVRNRMSVTLLRQEQQGPANSRNSGAAAARGDWLVFLDDDCRPASGWLAAFDAARLREDELVGGRTLNGVDQNLLSTASQQLLDYLYEYFSEGSSPLRFFASNNLAVAAHRFRRLGGFDRRFPLAAAEDREFCSRWLASGGGLKHIPGAVVTHGQDHSLASFFRQHFRYGQGAFTYHLLREQRDADRFPLQPLSFYTAMLRVPWRSASGWNAWAGAALLMLSQGANAAGFLYQAGQPGNDVMSFIRRLPFLRTIAARAASTNGAAVSKSHVISPDAAGENVQRFFSESRFAALHRLGEVLVPAYDGAPGAIEAGAPEFLDFFIGASPAALRETYCSGLDDLNAVARRNYGRDFAEVSGEHADAILRPLVVAWNVDMPEDPLVRFICEVHKDLRAATVNSRQWAEAKSSSGRWRAKNTGTYFHPIE